MTNITEWQHQYFFYPLQIFRLRGIDVVINEASHLTRCDVKQSESADRKCAGLTPSGLGYNTRSYKMYKTPSSNYKQNTLEEKNVPCFKRFQVSGKTICASVCLAIFFATDVICVPWQVELSIAQRDENHYKHGVFCPPGELNRDIRSVFC